MAGKTTLWQWHTFKDFPKAEHNSCCVSGLLRLETALVMPTRLAGGITANQVNMASIRPLQIPIGKYLYILNKELNSIELITALLGYET